jgi:hypothetical protein
MDPDNTDTPNITYRILRRANLIIEAVRTHKVIDDLTKLMKVNWYLAIPAFGWQSFLCVKMIYNTVFVKCL